MQIDTTKQPKSLSVTVGIPAFNEQINIQLIIKDILNQYEDGFFKIEKIIVISDGSTDATFKNASKVKDAKIKVINGVKRLGKPERMNQIFKMSTSDIVVVLDSDIKLNGDHVISEMVRPFIDNSNIQLVSGYLKPFTPHNYTQKLISKGNDIWETAMEIAKSEMYYCGGPMRAFGKKLYSEITFPSTSADDVYPYLYAKNKGYGFKHVSKVLGFYELPANTNDFEKQAARYMDSQTIHSMHFGWDITAKNFTIGTKIKAKALILHILKDPIYTLGYFVLWLKPLFKHIGGYRSYDSKWDVIKSTKKIKQKITGKQHLIFSIYDDLKNPYYGGGGAVSVYNIAKRLSGIYDVTILTGNYVGAKDYVKDKIRFKRVGPSFFGPRLGQLTFQFLLPFYVLTMDVDLWIENSTPPFTFSLLPFFTKKPVYGFVHMLTAEDMTRKFKLPIFKLIEKIVLSKYKYFIVVTDALKQQIKTVNPTAKIFHIPNCVDDEILNRQRNYLPEGKDGNVLYLGRIEIDQKGIDLLLEAFKKVEKKIALNLVIAGSGIKHDLDLLKTKIANLQLENRVTITGRVDGEAKYNAFENASMVVVPSRFETFGIVALEALAFGIPVITYDIEGFKWLPSNVCLKVRPYDVEKLSQAMLDVSQSKELSKKLSEQGRIFAKNYTWKNSVRKFEKALNTL